MSRYIEIDTPLLKTVTAGRMSAKALWRRIMQQPTIDIVRCKECKHREEYPCKVYHDDDWFCADGEREGE